MNTGVELYCHTLSKPNRVAFLYISIEMWDCVYIVDSSNTIKTNLSIIVKNYGTGQRKHSKLPITMYVHEAKDTRVFFRFIIID